MTLTNSKFSSIQEFKPFLSIMTTKMPLSWLVTPVSEKVLSCLSWADPNSLWSMMVSNQHLITLDNRKLKLVMKNIHKLQSPLKSSSIKWRFMTVLGSKIIKVKNTKYQTLSLSKDYWICTKTLNWSLWLMSHISVRPEQISCPN